MRTGGRERTSGEHSGHYEGQSAVNPNNSPCAISSLLVVLLPRDFADTVQTVGDETILIDTERFHKFRILSSPASVVWLPGKVGDEYAVILRAQPAVSFPQLPLMVVVQQTRSPNKRLVPGKRRREQRGEGATANIERPTSNVNIEAMKDTGDSLSSTRGS